MRPAGERVGVGCGGHLGRVFGFLLDSDLVRAFRPLVIWLGVRACFRPIVIWRASDALSTSETIVIKAEIIGGDGPIEGHNRREIR